MTQKQIDQVRKELRKKTYKDWTEAEKRIDRELYCREMINSCLIYGSANYNFYNKESEQFVCYAIDYVRELGEKRVKELFEEQCADFAKRLFIEMYIPTARDVLIIIVNGRMIDMARLDYNEDNYFGNNNRGVRYDIYINGYAEKTNLSENEVDYFLDIYEQRGFSASEIEIKQH